MKTFEGKLVSKSIKVGIVAARFNEFITSKLLSGALDGLLRTFMWRGFREPLRSRWWRRRWQRAAGMTPSSASAR